MNLETYQTAARTGSPATKRGPSARWCRPPRRHASSAALPAPPTVLRTPAIIIDYILSKKITKYAKEKNFVL